MIRIKNTKLDRKLYFPNTKEVQILYEGSFLGLKIMTGNIRIV